MKWKKIIQYILLPLLVISAAVAFYIYKEFNRTHTDTARLKPDFSLAATAIIKEFETDESSSNKKYWDKVMRINGIVKEINRDEKGFYSVILGDTTSMSSVRCSMDSTYNNEAMKMEKGNEIYLKGICTGFNADEMLGSDVILVRCVIDSKQ